MATTEAEVNQAHREKMARIKAVKDRIYASKTIEKGLLIVHTGTGKGKSTAAWGLAMRMPRARPAARRGAVRQGPARDRRALLPGALSRSGRRQGHGRRLHLGDPGPRARHRRGARRLGRGAAHAGRPRAAPRDPRRAQHRAAQGLPADRGGGRRPARASGPTCTSWSPAATPSPSFSKPPTWSPR